MFFFFYFDGRDSEVGIDTPYGPDGWASNPGRSEIFRALQKATRPALPSVQWVPGLSRW